MTLVVCIYFTVVNILMFMIRSLKVRHWYLVCIYISFDTTYLHGDQFATHSVISLHVEMLIRAVYTLLIWHGSVLKHPVIVLFFYIFVCFIMIEIGIQCWLLYPNFCLAWPWILFGPPPQLWSVDFETFP